MKPHLRSAANNLVTSADDGSVWAAWQVLDVPVKLCGDDDRNRHRSAVESMLRALPGPAMLFSVCQPVTVERLEEALRAEAIPGRRLDRQVRLTVDALDDGQILYDRTFWLAAQVRKGRSEHVVAASKRTTERLWAALPFSDSPIFDDEHRVKHLNVAAQEVEQAIGLTVAGDRDLPQPGMLLVRRADVTDLEWLVVRLARRGTTCDLPLDSWEANDPDTAGRERMMRLGDAGWRENYTGGVHVSGLPRCVAASADDCDVSFQSTLVVSKAPAEVRFPGHWSEWFLRAGNNPGAFPVDWFMRVTPRRDRKFRGKLDTRLTNAIDQVDEHNDEAGPAEHVLADADALRGLRDRVAQGEPVLESVTWFTITAPDYETLEDRVRTFRANWSSDVWDLQRPVGNQEDYVRASQPGAVLSADVAGDYVRYLTADLVAMGAPFAGAKVGDPFGALIGVNLGDGLAGLVFWDPGYSIRHLNRSGSAFFIGVTGAGKSSSVKTIMSTLIARGSRFVVLDPAGEYLAECEAVGGQRIDPFDPHVSLDPLAIYKNLPPSAADKDRAEARERAANGAIGVFDALWKYGIEPHGEMWSRLRQLVDHALDNRGQLADVLRWIREDVERIGVAHRAAVVEARAAGEVSPPPPSNPFENLIGPLEVAAHLPRLRAVFDPNLIPFRATAPLTVIVTTGMQLPKDEKEKASAEELQSLALMLASLHSAKEGVYLDRSRYGAVVFDEARAIIASPYGRGMVWDLLDQGRKFQAGGLISLTDASVVPEQFYAQVETRFVFRIGTEKEVEGVRAILGPAGQDPHIGDLLTTLRNGECVFRDARGQVGRMHLLLPLDPDIARVVSTTPTLDVTPDDDGELVGAS